jgi:hypothetical protein
MVIVAHAVATVDFLEIHAKTSAVGRIIVTTGELLPSMVEVALVNVMLGGLDRRVKLKFQSHLQGH